MSEGSDEELVRIEIRGLPIGLHARSQAHSDELMREFRLLAEQMRQEGTSGVPRELIDLVAALQGQYSAFTEEQEDALQQAIAREDETIDLTYQLPAHVSEGVLALGVMLDRADELCREGQHLLTLATPPELVAYRQWFLDEFTRQIAGEPPTAWIDSPQARLLPA
ncbi:MAG TPA: hypothetical protein VFJ98_03510 [Mycobacteriales bacterium]|nr:hypothetical protein [Mycobacteriales bacterium]